MSINRWMDQEVVIFYTHTHTHNGILFNHNKEQIWVSSSEVDEPQACYTEWSQKNKYCILTHILEKAMAPHSSTLAWKIPWVEEPGGLQSVGSLSQTWLSNFTFTFHFHALEKAMAPHSSVLAWRIPGTGEPGGLQSMGLHRVGHDWSNLAVADWLWY